ncbi:hypothetical protein KEU06_27250 [Pseudaminobacter sp. 19-2017]|uniref:2OG-Fe(II) oxygenase n=1 Tax=Pseudaminobacter soli (ex Zhang et al. 2022) TaxID=2831468 RepID=A0A942I4Q5_9HYPH|nr:hypothetical protein [Pseudaminobacter soli]MBS3652293.1 hypothetical protein [Pseudaminobacter soli]
MFDFDEVQKHTRARIDSATLVIEPFPHLYAHDLLPLETYNELISNLPSDSDYQAYRPPYQERLFIKLEGSQVSKLDSSVRSFWIEFERWINSQDFLDLMVAKFGELLKSNIRHRRSQLRETARNGKIPIVSRTLLARDYAHFALGPHTDAKNKFITALYYLPKGDELMQFGTSIYRPKKQGYTSWESEHHKHEDFDLVRTFENVPNTLFAFMKSDHSFHGVQPGEYPNVGRDLIMWFPEINAKDETDRPLSLDRSVFDDEKQGFFREMLGRVIG